MQSLVCSSSHMSRDLSLGTLMSRHRDPALHHTRPILFTSYTRESFIGVTTNCAPAQPTGYSRFVIPRRKLKLNFLFTDFLWAWALCCGNSRQWGQGGLWLIRTENNPVSGCWLRGPGRCLLHAGSWCWCRDPGSPGERVICGNHCSTVFRLHTFTWYRGDWGLGAGGHSPDQHNNNTGLLSFPQHSGL